MDIANILLSAVSGLLMVLWAISTWVIADMKKKQDKTAEDLAEYKVRVASEFVSKQEMKDVVSGINRALENYSTRLEGRFDKLDEKVDRMRDQ